VVRQTGFYRLCLGVAMHLNALAAWASPVPDTMSTDPALETVVVTGSLLPRRQDESSAPITVITAEDMHDRGLTTLADAIQSLSYSTGSVIGPQMQFGVTPGLKTANLFGLGPGFTKYLLNDRPMSDYPGLYNGSDLVANLSGIPEALIDRIEVVPGGLSSLYGSDAVAGVVNVILKKRLTGASGSIRYGDYQHGGGVSKRLSLSDGFSMGRLDVVGGVELNRRDPIWGYQRSLTASYFAGGTTPVVPERDYVVIGEFANGGPLYHMLDPTRCAGAASQFGGTLQLSTRADRGEFCGTTRAGFNTLDNSSRSVEGYLRANYRIGEQLESYLEVLATHDYTKFSDGAQSWSSDAEYGYFYDPSLQDLMSNLTSNVYRYRIGIEGSFGGSGWKYDVDATYAQYRLIRRTHVLFTQPLFGYFNAILGSNQGADPLYGAFPTFSPDYAALFVPLTPAQYAGMSGFTGSYSKTDYNLAAAQLTNANLARLPGGNVGLAVVLERADEDWHYDPDPRLLDGEVWNYSAVTGGGRRSRMAGTAELRLPLVSWLSADASGRYDNYLVSGRNIGKATYSLALQIQPTSQIALRGRFGTAFKAPSLADEFQGKSGFGATITDYYQCRAMGYSGSTLGNCPYDSVNVSLTASGNPRLRPITAHIWSAGFVWQPLAQTRLSGDFLHWAIKNEVAFQSSDELMQLEAACRLGELDIASPSCVAAQNQVTRNVLGEVVGIFLPKVNVSEETADAISAQLTHNLYQGRFGLLDLTASWSDMLKHTSRQYVGDSVMDLLHSPFNTDFKSKVDASIAWRGGDWSTTVYAVRTGRSPSITYGTNDPTAGTLSPWLICNLNVSYRWRNSVTLSVTADNLFDRMPPVDHGYTGFDSHPYNDGNYNVYGRAYYLEVRYAPAD
jgi:iron complex outermembrane receptor protein